MKRAVKIPLILVGLLVWFAINADALVDCIRAYRERNAAREDLDRLNQDVLDLEEKKLALKVEKPQKKALNK